MKLAFIFLSTFLVVSHQQYQLPRLFAYPQFSPAFIQQPTYYNDDFQDNRYYLDDYSTEQQVARFNNPAVIGSHIIALNEDGDKNVQPRFKVYGSQLQLGANQQNARFFFNTGVNNQAVVNAAVVNQGVVNPLLKTVTFTLTSTCTSYSVVTCVPRIGLNANIRPCRRKRQIDHVELFGDNNQQFPIFPTEIQKVEPTSIQQPRPAAAQDSHLTSIDIISSKEEQPISESNKYLLKEKLPRNGRFYNLWQSFATGTTITTWVIISSTTTLTSIPLDNAQANILGLDCLPAGLSFC